MANDRSDFGSILRRAKGTGRYYDYREARKLEKRGEVVLRPSYYVRVRAGKQQVTRRAGDTKAQAINYLAKLRTEVVRADFLGIEPVLEMSFAAFAEEWLEWAKHKHSDSSYVGEENKVRNQLIPQFGTKRLTAIRGRDIERFLQERGKKVWKNKKGEITKRISVATLNRDAALLSSIFARAIELGHARENPVAGVRRHREAQIAVPFLDFAAQDHLVACCPTDLREIVRLALDTGLRRGEFLALEWRDIDAGRAVVVIRESKAKRPRDVPLTPESFAMLAAMRDRRAIPLKGPDRVFHWIPVGWSQHFRNAWKKAATAADYPGLRFHDLRHTFASTLVRAGVPIPTVAKLLGHTTPQMVLTRYGTHAPADAAQQAIQALSIARSGAMGESVIT